MRCMMAGLLLILPVLWAQTGDRKPVFVAASIKLDPKADGSDSEGGPGMLRAQMTLKHYIMYAYDVKQDQATGDPNWTDAEHYAILAKLENAGDVAVPADSTPRQRAEAERARLRAAHENGVKLTAEPADMVQLAADLTRQLRVPVTDLTHLRGLYNFTLEWTPDDLKSAAGAKPLAGPSIFTALQEQLGLRLESQKATVDIIVVDSAERPSEN